MARHLGFMLLGTLLGGLVPAADLRVNPNRPGAYPTLQAALDAAQPGERILIEVDLPFASLTKTVIRKSVTIEAADSYRKFLGYSSTVGIQVPRIEIEALTPGLPLVLRRLNVVFYSMGTSPGSPGIATRGPIPGEIRFEDVGVHWFETPHYAIWSGLAVRLECTRLWMRDCEVIAADTLDRGGCIDIEDTRGASALEFFGDVLLLERCWLRAGSANFLLYSPCWGGAGQHPHGGRGGTALFANSRMTLVIASALSDGNGGSVQGGPWTVTPTAGQPGSSALTSATGSSASWASWHETGRAGRIDASGPDRTRGTRTLLGRPELHFELLGSGRLGESIELVTHVPEGQLAAVVLSAGIAPVQTNYGWLVPDALRVLGVVAVDGIRRLAVPVPPDPVLVDLVLAGQLALQYSPELGNPSLVPLRR